MSTCILKNEDNLASYEEKYIKFVKNLSLEEKL